MKAALVIPLDQVSMQDIAIVGGKNASLGEMVGNLATLGAISAIEQKLFVTP
jgi:phosphoenolpyruvate synthase/pyruvate phosphate dikinase